MASKPALTRMVCLSLLGILLYSVTLSGCNWPLDSDKPDESTKPSESAKSSESDYRIWPVTHVGVTTPATVAVGSEFEVMIWSMAPNGCWRAGRTDVWQANPLSVTLTPYDEEYVDPERICTADAPTLRRSVHLLASVKGAFEVNVQQAEGTTIQRVVVVQ